MDDHCAAVDLVIESGRLGETYHVGSGDEATIEQIADTVLDALGKPQSLKTIIEDRPGHDRRYLLDCTKIRRELGWGAEGELRSGSGKNRRVVCRESKLVGAASGSVTCCRRRHWRTQSTGRGLTA